MLERHYDFHRHAHMVKTQLKWTTADVQEWQVWEERQTGKHVIVTTVEFIGPDIIFFCCFCIIISKFIYRKLHWGLICSSSTHIHSGLDPWGTQPRSFSKQSGALLFPGHIRLCYSTHDAGTQTVFVCACASHNSSNNTTQSHDQFCDILSTFLKAAITPCILHEGNWFSSHMKYSSVSKFLPWPISIVSLMPYVSVLKSFPKNIKLPNSNLNVFLIEWWISFICKLCYALICSYR